MRRSDEWLMAVATESSATLRCVVSEALRQFRTFVLDSV